MKVNKKELKKLIAELPVDYRRVFSIIAHIDHGKSSTADHLLRRAGVASGKQEGPAISYDPQEIESSITIFTSVTTLCFEYGGQKYLFQLNDTPGHLSFTGEVSRALRASDGVLVLVDALEGMMVQTETNMRMAIADELCQPVLFINKVDRLIGELGLSPSEIFQRLDKIVRDFNHKVQEFVPAEFKDYWSVSFKNNSVGVGSAKDGWGFTVELLMEKDLSPQDVFAKYLSDDIEWLQSNLPLDEVLIRLVAQHLPSPRDAQLYKIPHIWSGELSPEYVKIEQARRRKTQFLDDLKTGLESIFRENNLI